MPPAATSPSRRDLYINREISLLEFQRRVLEEAKDPAMPLLERLKFVAILHSNLDEFFMVRVAGLKKQLSAGVREQSVDAMLPDEQLNQIRDLALTLLTECGALLRDELLPRLRENGVVIYDYVDLSGAQREAARVYFEEAIFPVLTPLAFDPGRPFPHISNLSLNLAVLIEDRGAERRFARIKVPGSLPRLLPVDVTADRDGKSGKTHGFVWIEQVVAAHLDSLFPGMRVLESHPFRVTRDADTLIQELEAGDLLESVEASLRQRRFGTVVGLSLNKGMPAHIRQILTENLEVSNRDIYVLQGPLGLGNLMGVIGKIDRFDLKDKPFRPSTPLALRQAERAPDIWKAIRSNDILLHHPYDSFGPVLHLLESAARDPQVLAIKMTLYRVGRNSPVVRALLDAREHGKQVAVLVELKARFDEESNVEWAKMLEATGVHVIYGLLGLKTHSKTTLIVREEESRIRRYVHLASGNYNAVTANLYTDIGFFTCDTDIGADVTDLFNYLTGYSAKADYRKLLVAPINLRARMAELIRREIAHQQHGERGHLVFKMNALVDEQMINVLYEASAAGVRVDLIVRGMCSLRPGIPGLSENITVTSIVGRFLEHSRIYWFRNAGKEEVFIGSADLMTRNIDHRVEVLFPVENAALTRQVRDGILAIQLADTAKARRLSGAGSYERVRPAEGQEPFSSQAWFLRQGAL
ncbi:MAG: polyphosphate kinase 1 [Candidatus Schekmanbacteria bacterium]|nr:polyphosphate kinase 1 [Candidatus Schekmanbacteria bacterium]